MLSLQYLQHIFVNGYAHVLIHSQAQYYTSEQSTYTKFKLKPTQNHSCQEMLRITIDQILFPNVYTKSSR